MQKKPFSALGLSPELLRAVARMGYEEAVPIQCEAIPVLMRGRDVVGQSQTGSGKTAAFAIPVIERIDPAARETQALVLCPTRELAVQVAEEVAKLAAFKRGVRELPIYGGASYERQFRGLEAGAQIVIGTPGRVIDHLERGSLDLRAVKTVVLDEADRMLDMGFREDIETILSRAPADRQTILFSATIPPPIRRLIDRFTNDPVHIAIESPTLTAPEIDQVYYEVGPRSKLELLCRLLDLQDMRRAIIFCATKATVDDLNEHLLARGYSADRLHGDMAQSMRERVMRRFREGKIELLVATDVAARGLDVEEVEAVFNYDLPHDAEDYVHRIGRTGRAGRRGRAVTFVAGREIWRFQQFSKITRSRPRIERAPTLSEVEGRQASRVFESLRETLAKGDYSRHDPLIDPLLDAGHTATDIASALLHLLIAETKRDPQKIAEDEPRPDKGRAPSAERRSWEREDRRGEPATAMTRRGHVPHEKRGRQSGRSEPVAMVRLDLDLGKNHGVRAGDILGFVAGAGGLNRTDVGAIKIMPDHTQVEINRKFAAVTVRRLDGMRFKTETVRARLVGPE